MTSPVIAIVSDLCACGQERLYSGRRPVDKDDMTHGPSACVPHVGSCAFSCVGCRERYRITGDTPEARERALAEWPGCTCSPARPGGAQAKHPRPDGSASRPAAGPDVAAVAPGEGAAAAATTGFRPNPAPMWPWFRRPRLRLTGVPAWVRRRVAAWPFDPTDLRAH